MHHFQLHLVNNKIHSQPTLTIFITASCMCARISMKLGLYFHSGETCSTRYVILFEKKWQQQLDKHAQKYKNILLIMNNRLYKNVTLNFQKSLQQAKYQPVKYLQTNMLHYFINIFQLQISPINKTRKNIAIWNITDKILRKINTTQQCTKTLIRKQCKWKPVLKCGRMRF